ncbi:MAG: nucleotidyltransferase family protein [Peptostreptococcaceae bacterium]|nr:nucleotidyltransferase family protein [Peptostreptococcaceae bacterium]
MKTIGIIAEYNPFHLGHKYLIDEARVVTDAERVVVVMSGNSVQRGDFAIVDKFARAREAIRAGADLVLELPFCYSSQSAEFFAYGGSKILHSLGLVDYLCFGSETNNADSQWRIANLLYEESPALQAEIKEQMKKGISFPAARQSALEKIYPNEANYSIMNNPNDILAIEYIKSLFRLQSGIEPISVQRIGGAYYDPRLEIEVPSATAIRERLMHKYRPQREEMTQYSSMEVSEQKIKKIMDDNLGYIIGRNANSVQQSEEDADKSISMEEQIKSATTGTMAAYLLEQRDKNTLASIEDYFSELSSIIIRQKDELDCYFEISEGIDNLLKTKIFETNNVHDLAMEIKSKRYTYTRARRMLMNILVGLKKEDMQIVKESDEIPYARILAFNDVGRKMIKECSFQIELINKLADFKPKNPLHQVLQKYDEIVGELFYMKYEYKHYGKRVYTDKMTSPVYISDEENIE